MDRRLRILHLEDSLQDAELIRAILESDGLVCQCDRVVTRPEFVAGLEGEYDLILSDYSLPGFNGVSAQKLAFQRRPDLPFVFVSGTMGEEVAIERLNAGATDFVLKERLERLPRAVRRALQEAQNRKERQQAEAEVLRLNVELEARVLERTRQLAEANRELAQAEEEARLARREAERANRAKSQFVSRMSHDLRTPLNAILGFAQLLETDGDLSPEQIESVRHIRSGGAHLLALINEVLDIARIEAGQLALTPGPVRVADVLREVTELLRPLAGARGISLDVALDEAQSAWHVQADRQRLKQVLLNLVGNAVKYNRDGGMVRITGVRSGNDIRIRVSDTGPGIPAAKRALLFRPFERLGADQGSIEGTGLGLASAKGLIEAMNGAIGVEAPEDGATFWIELPDAEQPGRRPPADGQGAGTILYIEDNPSNVRLLERLLSRRPEVRLLVAGTGREGVACAARERPAMILLDLNLPDIPGEEVLQILLRDERTSGLPVVLLSADATDRQRRRLLQAGARAYLTKPIELPSLLTIIDQHLGQRQAS